MQTLFRAVKKSAFNQDDVHSFLTTRRLPGNVPYLIDNIWEFLRPEEMPSRRHSAYASPSAEIALASASARRNNPEDYVVCEIEANGTQMKMAHIQKNDAKEHEDIDRLRNAIFKAISGFADLTLSKKMEYAPLFLPGISKEEMQAAFNASPKLQVLEPIIRANSTFWQEASSAAQPHTGELFFEMLNGGQYRLNEVK